MARTIQELKDDASIIKNETDAGDNTASRVGTMFLDIIEYLGNLNTSSGSEDEGGSGGGGGGGVSLNEPLSSINNLARTPGSGNKVLVCQNGVWDYGDYGGGSTPTSGVTWNALAGSTDEQINLTHLATALNSCSFWGRNPVNGVVSGDMIDVGSITMNGKITMYNATNDKVEIYVDQSGNLKFNGNIYATGGVSALGNSSSGGGGGGGSTVSWTKIVDSGTKIATITIDGESTDVYAPTSGGAGGATTLGGLNDVILGSLALDDGQYLRYNSSNGKWENASFSSLITTLNGITNSPDNSSYLINYNRGWSLTKYEQSSSGINVSIVGSGNAITDADVSNNFLTLTRGTVLTSLPVASVNTLGCIKVGDHLDINSNGKLSVNGTNLSVASASTAASATEAGKLSDNTARKAWGQTYWQGGTPKDIDGNMNSVKDIYMNFSDSSTSSRAIKMKCFQSSTVIDTVLLNNSDTLSFGYGARTNGLTTEIQGQKIVFAVNNSTPRVEAGEFTSTGLFHVKQGNRGIQIGDGVIKWNSENNSLYVEKAGGGVANFYASGGVSALGFSSTNGRNASVNYLVADSISVSGDITDQDDVWHIDNSEFYHEGAVEASEVNASRFYISPNNFTPSSGNTNCILYAKKVNGVNKLYFYNGSSEIQIA